MKKHEPGRRRLSLKTETIQLLAARKLEKAVGGGQGDPTDTTYYTCISQDYECFPPLSLANC